MIKKYIPELQEIQNIGNKLVTEMTKRHDDAMREIVMTYAEPPIKGEITKGKLRWRGLRMFTQNEIHKTTTWIEQRGKQIGPKHTFEIKF